MAISIRSLYQRWWKAGPGDHSRVGIRLALEDLECRATPAKVLNPAAHGLAVAELARSFEPTGEAPTSPPGLAVAALAKTNAPTGDGDNGENDNGNGTDGNGENGDGSGSAGRDHGQAVSELARTFEAEEGADANARGQAISELARSLTDPIDVG
jgi:hypothetical protein